MKYSSILRYGSCLKWCNKYFLFKYFCWKAVKPALQFWNFIIRIWISVWIINTPGQIYMVTFGKGPCLDCSIFQVSMTLPVMRQLGS